MFNQIFILIESIKIQVSKAEFLHFDKALIICNDNFMAKNLWFIKKVFFANSGK